MKVLIYIEPHPIRNTLSHFKDVARNFVPLLRDSDRSDIRLFANNDTFRAIEKEIPSASLPRIIRSTEVEERQFTECLVDWDDEGIPIWVDLMQGQGVAENYRRLLSRVWNDFPFDVIVHWGENGAITQFATDRGIAQIAMELGCTRRPFKNSLIMDPFGTNGGSIFPKLTENEVKEAVCAQGLSPEQAVLSHSADHFATPHYNRYKPLPDGIIEKIAKSKRVAFFPLQLYDDANLLQYSKYNSVEEVVLDAVPKLAQYDVTTIIKPHPAAKFRPKGVISNDFARGAIQSWADKVVWLGEEHESVDNTSLINASDFVVTVNSSLGFESLYYGKPVTVLGDAVYKPEGVFPKLDEVASGGHDLEHYDQFTGYIRRFFLLSYLLPQGLFRNLYEFENVVHLWNVLKQKHNNHPGAMTREFFAIRSAVSHSVSSSRFFYGPSGPSNGVTRPKIDVPQSQPQVGPTRQTEQVELSKAVKSLLSVKYSTSLDCFKAWLDEAWETPAGRFEILKATRVFDEEFYLKENTDVAQAGIDPTKHYADAGYAENRRVSPQFSIASSLSFLEELKSEAEDPKYWALVPIYELDETCARRREEQLAQAKAKLAAFSGKICVVAHTYYTDFADELVDYLNHIPEEFDLIVTLPDWGTRRTREVIKASYPNAVFYEVPNRGRDVGPFVDLLPILVDKDYDAVLKIHSKRGYFRAGRYIPEFGEVWRSLTLRSILGNKSKVQSILDALRSHSAVNMVGPNDLYVSLENYPYSDEGRFSSAILGGAVALEKTGFFAGTMFWVKPRCLKPLIDKAGLDLKAFRDGGGGADGEIAHILERMFGHIAGYGDGRIAAVGCEKDAEVLLDPEFADKSLDQTFEKICQEERTRKSTSGDEGGLWW